MDLLGSRLSAVDHEFREELRDWLSDNLTPEHRAAAHLTAMTDDAHFEVRLDWERRLADAGWLGITWPREYGGRGGTVTQEIVFLVEHGGAGAPYWIGIQGRDLFGPTLIAHGTAEQKARFLPPIMDATEFWGQGYSEPDAGSDLADVRTRAVREGDGWTVNGQKIWTSFGAYANWIYALCRTDPDQPKHKDLSFLLIPVDQPGVEVRPIRHMAGGTDFCEVFFNDARTDTDLVVGGVGHGWAVAMGSLDIERFTTALPHQARFPHQVSDLLDELRRRGLDRDRLVRQQVASIWSDLKILEWTNNRLFDELIEGRDLGPRSSLAKVLWTTWHQRFADAAIDLLGLDVTNRASGGPAAEVVDTFLNSRAETIYAGTNEIQKTILGERALGLPRR